MNDKRANKEPGGDALDRRKQALRENLKRRKEQIRGMKKGDAGQLKPRLKGLKAD